MATKKDKAKAMAEQSWPIDGRHGPENWARNARGAFVRVVVDGEAFAVGETDLDWLDCRYVRPCKDCPGVFPSTFRHCPTCGMETRSVKTVAGIAEDAPNGGAKAMAGECVGLPSGGDRVEMPLPPGRLFAFATPEEGQGLYAVARDEGAFHRLSETAGGWVKLFNLPNATRFLDTAWTMVVDQDFLVFPTHDRLIHVTLSQGRARQWTLPEAEGLTCLGGAARLNDRVHVPAIRSGRFVLMTLESDPVKPIVSLLEVEGGSGLSDNGLGRPIRTGRGIFWPGGDGYLSLSDEPGAVPRWILWRPDFTPLPSQAPLLSRDRIGYQFGVVDGMGGSVANTVYAFHRMTATTEASEPHVVSGAVLAAGPLVCWGHWRLVEQPWLDHQSPLNAELSLPADRFLYPVVAFEGGRAVMAIVEDRGQLSRLAEGRVEGRGLRAEVVFAPDPHRVEHLGMIVHLKAPGQLSAFVHGDGLFVYDSGENRLCRWPLAGRAA